MYINTTQLASTVWREAICRTETRNLSVLYHMQADCGVEQASVLPLLPKVQLLLQMKACLGARVPPLSSDVVNTLAVLSLFLFPALLTSPACVLLS